LFCLGRLPYDRLDEILNNNKKINTYLASSAPAGGESPILTSGCPGGGVTNARREEAAEGRYTVKAYQGVFTRPGFKYFKISKLLSHTYEM
jgi:hypothetical protein